jgi:hypothetical protein
MVFIKKLNDYQEKFFDAIIVIIYILIFATFLGIFNNAPSYLNDINYYFRIYICLFLIWRFNPLRKIYIFTNLDRKIAFNSGVFILTTTILNKYISNIKTKLNENNYVNTLRDGIDHIIRQFLY